MKLSILILSCPSRRKTFLQNILDTIEQQINSENLSNEVEVLCLYDNKTRSIGEKRNNLIDIANGEYVCFVDDDDIVSTNYVRQLYNALITNPDIDSINFLVQYHDSNFNTKNICAFSKNIAVKKIDNNVTFLPTSHLSVIKKSIAKQVRYKLSNHGEDADWSKRVIQHINTENIIFEVLYTYRFDRQTSESVVNLRERRFIN